MVKIIRRLQQESSDFSKHNFHPIVEKIYLNRGINAPTELEKSLNDLYSYELLMNARQAACLLADAIRLQQHILVIGDFDSDGATSTALAVDALSQFGAQKVNFLVPNRFEFGYGLSPEIVEHAQSFQPDLIITVDNGIANHAGVKRAKELGYKVIITDHHMPAETLPEADVIVNPNQNADTFPSKCLAGVGVIFYVMLALRAELRARQWFSEQQLTDPNMASFLDLVALGTIADVVPLDKNNRILIHQGLARIRKGLVRPGIAALLTIAKRQMQALTATDLAFTVAPRLNAAGRLDDMSLGIHCLLSKNMDAAVSMAKELDGLNQERKLIETQMQQQAFQHLAQVSKTQLNTSQLGVCLYDPSWHQGVVGILASRVKDKLQRPVIVFAKSQEGELKGSGRSVAKVNIRDILASIDSQYPKVLKRFGGHAMAAGLSIAEENYSLFQEYFAKEVAKHLQEEDTQSVLYTDGELQENDFSLELAETLRFLEPWGQGFPEPSFDGHFQVYDQRLVGSRHLKMLVSRPGSAQLIDAIAFNVDTDRWPNHHCQKILAVYKLDVNTYQDRRSLQLLIEHLDIVD